MRILALDPGRHCGFAFGHTKDQVAASGTWDLGLAAGSRPSVLATRLRHAIAQHQPDVVAVEIASMGGKFRRAQVALDELAGVIKATAQGAGCQVWAFHISTWKARAIGNGHAKKPVIIRALRTYFGIVASDDNQADAIGIMLAAQKGPPPLSEKKETKRVERVLAKRQKSFLPRR